METSASVPPEGALIQFHQVTKSFPGQRALDEVTFDIGRGQVHALVGENGSGKSTLIKILAGYYVPDAGSQVVVDGETLQLGSVPASHRAGLRFVHQHLGLINELNTVDNIAIEAGYVRSGTGLVNWKATAAKAEELLARLHTTLDLYKPVGELRAVERSTIAIARALSTSAGGIKGVVLDEPTAALPPNEVDALIEVVRQVRDSGISVLYVSHRLAEILDIAEAITVLRDGKMVSSGTAHGLTRSRLVEMIIGRGEGAPVVDRTEAPPPRSAAPVCSIRNLRTDQLAGVDFEMYAGEVLGFAGLDGSGREEVTSALAGAIPVTLELTGLSEGTVTTLTPRSSLALGLTLTLPNRHPSAGIFEFPINEDLCLPTIRNYSQRTIVRRRQEKRAVNGWMEKLDVRPRNSDVHLSSLSGGNQQKAIIAKWLNADPAVLLYEDPTSGVDIGSRHVIYQLLRAQAEDGKAIVVASSDMEDLTGVCDRVLVMYQGRVHAQLVGREITEEALLHAATGGTADVTASTSNSVGAS